MFPEHLIVLFDQTVIAPQLLWHAARIAVAGGATITLLNVLDSTVSGPHEQFIDPLQWHMIKMEAESSLSKVAERLQEHGLQVQKEVFEGWSVEQILKYTHESGADLIAVDRRGTTIGERLHLLLQCISIPMLIVPSAENHISDEITVDRYHKILVPLDGSHRAEFALPIAVNLAKAFGASLLLAHVVHKPEMPSRTPASPEDAELLSRLVERNRTEAVAYLEQLVAGVDANAEPRVLVSDNVSVALHGLMEQEQVDLVTLSAHGYSSEPKWPYGSIAYNLINYLNQPLLVIQDLPVSEIQIGQENVPPREKTDRS